MTFKTVRSRAPLRLGLAGGGTDVSPYCDVYGGSVINATIDRYAWTTITPNKVGRVNFCSADLGVDCSFDISENIEIKKPLLLHKAVYLEVMRKYNNGEKIPLTITTSCEAPMGSGLGASSTIVVSMIKAYAEFLNLALDDYELADFAVFVEREICNLQGGRQDQYAASFGGFNFIEFGKNKEVLVNSLRIKNWVINEFESSLLLYFTGVSRESANIIRDQSENLSQNKEEALNAMHKLKEDAFVMKRALLEGDFKKLVDCVNQSWMNKVKTSGRVSNERISEIMDTAFAQGALAGKVSGAGGGGFMWFIVPAERKIQIARSLSNFGGLTSGCHFTKKGAESWIVK